MCMQKYISIYTTVADTFFRNSVCVYIYAMPLCKYCFFNKLTSPQQPPQGNLQLGY